MTSKEFILDALQRGPLTLMALSKATGLKYELVKQRCRELLTSKKIDRLMLDHRARNRSRFEYTLGTGQVIEPMENQDRPDLEARYARREQRSSGIRELPDGTKVGPNGGKVHFLTDSHPWHDDGQLSKSYGVARAKSAMLGE